MAARVPSLLLFAGILAGSARAAGQEPAVAPAPATPDELRLQRIEEQKAGLAREIAAIDAFGHADEFLAAVRVRIDQPKDQRWVPTNDGWVPRMSLDRYLRWNTPAEGRTLPVALDVELPDHPLPAIVDFNRQLRAHGIDFLFVVFPTRIQLYPELLIPLEKSDGLRSMSEGTTRFLVALADAGVEVLDLAPIFADHRFGTTAGGADPSDILYLRSNQHWSPRAAELAASSVADRLRAFPWFVPGPAREGKDFVVQPVDLEYVSPSDEAPADAAPETLKIRRIRTPRGKRVEDEDEKSPIVMLGDSFVNIHESERCDFLAQLYRFTQWKIDAIASHGGSERTARDALRRRDDGLAGKKVVIWMFSEQVLRPNQGWALLPMFGQ